MVYRNINYVVFNFIDVFLKTPGSFGAGYADSQQAFLFFNAKG